MSMGASRDGNYTGQRLGFSRAWKNLEPISDDDLAVIEKMLDRPGGRITLPKNEIAGLVLRLRATEAAFKAAAES